MAIVTCPYCGGRISSLMKSCPHCNNPLGELGPEDRERLRVQRWRDQVFRAAQLSYLALVMLMVGAGWWWFQSPTGWHMPPPLASLLLVFFGTLLYLGARGWTLWLKLGRNRPS